jgi:hypothetical protein
VPNEGDPPVKKPQDTPSNQPNETVLESPGEVVVTHYTTPPQGPPDKQIHPRRRLPPVPNAPSQEPRERKSKP